MVDLGVDYSAYNGEVGIIAATTNNEIYIASWYNLFDICAY